MDRENKMDHEDENDEGAENDEMYEEEIMMLNWCLQSNFACSITFGGADNGADGGLSIGVDTLNSLCGRISASPTHTKKHFHDSNLSNVTPTPIRQARREITTALTIAYVLRNGKRFASVQGNDPVHWIWRTHNNLFGWFDTCRLWRRFNYMFVNFVSWQWASTWQWSDAIFIRVVVI